MFTKFDLLLLSLGSLNVLSLIIIFFPQSFCSALSQELTEYYRLIAVLEAQQSQGESSLTLRRLAVWTHDPFERMKMLGILVDGCKRKQIP